MTLWWPQPSFIEGTQLVPILTWKCRPWAAASVTDCTFLHSWASEGVIKGRFFLPLSDFTVVFNLTHSSHYICLTLISTHFLVWTPEHFHLCTPFSAFKCWTPAAWFLKHSSSSCLEQVCVFCFMWVNHVKHLSFIFWENNLSSRENSPGNLSFA